MANINFTRRIFTAMGAHHHHHHDHDHNHRAAPNTPQYRKVLWLALIVNAAMFGIEIAAGVRGQSTALLADALDFLGDALNYGASLWVLSYALATRAKFALLKGLAMTSYGVFIIAKALWAWHSGALPDSAVMGTIGFLALAANLFVAYLLYAFREGDANMRAVWLCTRNDAIGNVLILIAAALVYVSASSLPDLIAASIIAVLAMVGGVSVIRQALAEING